MKDIEYLSLYLPYNIEVECQWVEHRAFLHGIEAGGDCCVKIFKLVGDDLIHDSNYYPAGDIKPYLHPLSMLTEEMGKWLEDGYLKDSHTIKTYGLDGCCWFEDYLGKGEAMDLPFIVFQEVLRRHGDLFGLIDQGKAIDKSKL